MEIKPHTILDEIKEEVEAYNAKKRELVEKLRDKFPKIFQPYFNKSEVITSFKWTQYTPYFNDGDSCTFSVNHYITVNDDELYRSDFDAETRSIIEDIEDILREIPEDFMLDLFGDHAEITVYKNGEISVNEYEHE